MRTLIFIFLLLYSFISIGQVFPVLRPLETSGICFDCQSYTMSNTYITQWGNGTYGSFVSPPSDYSTIGTATLGLGSWIFGGNTALNPATASGLFYWDYPNVDFTVGGVQVQTSTPNTYFNLGGGSPVGGSPISNTWTYVTPGLGGGTNFHNTVIEWTIDGLSHRSVIVTALGNAENRLIRNDSRVLPLKTNCPDATLELIVDTKTNNLYLKSLDVTWNGQTTNHLVTGSSVSIPLDVVGMSAGVHRVEIMYEYDFDGVNTGIGSFDIHTPVSEYHDVRLFCN